MKAVVDEKARTRLKHWRALTRFRRAEAFGQFSFLEIEMETGVTHQIRVHLAATGHPIVGDNLYGIEGAQDFNLRRHFLHACRLEFSHPVENRLMKIESELPEELNEVVARLRLET
jgi:23S rRNA pseudouridine1911/1915/1917 synthase